MAPRTTPSLMRLPYHAISLGCFCSQLGLVEFGGKWLRGAYSPHESPKARKPAHENPYPCPRKPETHESPKRLQSSHESPNPSPRKPETPSMKARPSRKPEISTPKASLRKRLKPHESPNLFPHESPNQPYTLNRKPYHESWKLSARKPEPLQER